MHFGKLRKKAVVTFEALSGRGRLEKLQKAAWAGLEKLQKVAWAGLVYIAVI